MRKYRDNDFWFEITTGPAPDGQPGARYYAVSCRRCSAHARYHASGTSNEGLRKIFTRAGWTLGKNRFKHYCPDCSRRHAAATASPIHDTASTPPPPNRIQHHWLSLTDDQRVEFWHWLHEHYACWIGNSGRISLIAASQPQPQPQPPVPEPLTPQAPAPEPVEVVSAELTFDSDDDDDDVADWWKELTASKQAKSGDANES